MDWGRGGEEEAGFNVARRPRKLFLTAHMPTLPLTHTVTVSLSCWWVRRAVWSECSGRVMYSWPGSPLTSDVYHSRAALGVWEEMKPTMNALLLRAALLHLGA